MSYARLWDEIDKLYKTSRWRKLRSVIKARDFGECQKCKRRGIITKESIVHYKIEVRDDFSLFWNEENLEFAYVACHNKEHSERSGGRKKVKTKTSVVKFLVQMNANGGD